MFENIMNFFKKLSKKDSKVVSHSKEAAKERLHLVLMQDRANVSADFLELMKQEIIEVIKKYIDVDESAIDVRLTNKENADGTNGAPALYANIPILNIKSESKKIVEHKEKVETKNNKEEQIKKVETKNNEEEQIEKVETKNNGEKQIKKVGNSKIKEEKENSTIHDQKEKEQKQEEKDLDKGNKSEKKENDVEDKKEQNVEEGNLKTDTTKEEIKSEN